MFASVSFVAFCIAFLIYFGLIREAFNKHLGWGLVLCAFPIGTYFYAKRFWEESGKRIIWTGILIVVSLVCYAISYFMYPHAVS